MEGADYMKAEEKDMLLCSGKTGEQRVPLSLKEYLECYNPLSAENIGPYIPEDGAAIQFSLVKLYRDGAQYGFMRLSGLTAVENLKTDAFFLEGFVHNLSCESQEAGIIHYTYGNGSHVRDATEDEMRLVCVGAITGDAGPETRYSVQRSEVKLPPVSPLTERGMSRFFTAVAQLAEDRGLKVRGIDKHDMLQLYREGEWAIAVDESGGGSRSMAEYRPDLAAQGDTSSVLFLAEGPDENSLICEIQALRKEIPEYLFPRDYPLAEQEQIAGDGALTQIL